MKVLIVYLGSEQGRGWSIEYSGTGRQFERGESLQLEGALSDRLALIKERAEGADRVQFLLDDSAVFWLMLDVPFRQTKKIKATLPAVLAEYWPGHADEMEWRYQTGAGQDENQLLVCGVRRAVLSDLAELLTDAKVVFDSVVPLSALVPLSEFGMPVVLWQQSGASVHLPWLQEQPWNYLPIPMSKSEDQGTYIPDTEPVKQWLRSVVRGLPEREQAMEMLSENRIYHAGLGIQLPKGLRLPPVEQVTGMQEDLGMAMMDRGAKAEFGSTTFDFSEGLKGKRSRTSILRSAGWLPVALVAASFVVIVASSAFSLQGKKAEETFLRQSYRTIFLRAFPNSKLEGNLLKKGRAMLTSGADVDESPGVLPMEILKHLGTALPVDDSTKLKSVKLDPEQWSLSGVCSDFGCVDQFRANLSKIEGVQDVKLQNAKQSVDQKSVKFSLSVNLKGESE